MKKTNNTTEGPDGLVYTARLPPSSATLNYLAELIRGHLKKIGSRWRALPSGKIAAIVLAVLHCDQRPGDLAGGNGIHRTTVTRWVREVVGLLATRAPRLDRALRRSPERAAASCSWTAPWSAPAAAPAATIARTTPARANATACS